MVSSEGFIDATFLLWRYCARGKGLAWVFSRRTLILPVKEAPLPADLAKVTISPFFITLLVAEKMPSDSDSGGGCSNSQWRMPFIAEAKGWWRGLHGVRTVKLSLLNSSHLDGAASRGQQDPGPGYQTAKPTQSAWHRPVRHRPLKIPQYPPFKIVLSDGDRYPNIWSPGTSLIHITEYCNITC